MIDQRENEIILFVCAQGRDKGTRIWGINVGRDQPRVSHAEKKILHRQNEMKCEVAKKCC